MSRVLVDTNVLVSFLTDRNPGQQERAAALFQRAAEGETALVLPQVVLTELVYVLGNLYGVAADAVAAIVRDLLDAPGVTTLDELPWPALLELWPKIVATFADAALVAIAQRNRLAVATFDRKLVKRLRGEGLAVADL